MSNILRILLVSLFISTLFFYANAEEAPLDKANIIKANNLFGYKGDIIIEVSSYDEGYGVEGGANNIGMKYKAYLDMVSENNQKIIFYESKHVKELKIQLKNKELILFYDNKKIYDSKTMSKADFNEAIAIYPIYKYPYTITGFLYYSGGSSEYFPTYILDSALVGYVAQGYYELLTSENGYFVGIEVDNEYRLTLFYIEDYVSTYKWKNRVPYKVGQGHMYESITTEYLDEDGWIIK